MAKKSTKNRTVIYSGHYPLVKVCAFWGVVLAGVAGLISFILKLLEVCGVIITWGSKVSGACSMIAQIALFISAWLAAYDYVRNKPKAWKTVYIVFLVLGILGLVGLGLNSFI